MRSTQRAVALVLIVAIGARVAAESEQPRRIPPVEMPGRAETLALARAYPDRIIDVEYRDGDWALRIDDRWFYWADGRLLPKEDRHRSAEFAAHRFYSWEPGLPPLRHIDEESAASLQRRVADMASDPPMRHSGFFDAVYRASTRAATLSHIVEHRFLGFRAQVHRGVVPALQSVEAEIRRLALTDPAVAVFLEEIRMIGAFSYRVIAGTRTRSFHSYGVAVDIIPRYYGRRQAYWRWALEAGIVEWWAVPYERRWMPPMAVVDAFENEGFVWGGKWLFYDTIHFEYRPEIRILSRLSSASRRTVGSQ